MNRLVIILFLVVSFIPSGFARGDGGKIGSAWTSGGKCDALEEWLAQFEQEFPGVSLKNANTKPMFMLKFANLLRDKYFVPVFGVPYDPTPNDFKNDLLNDVMKECSDIKKYTKVLQGAFGKGYNRHMWSKQITDAIQLHKDQEQWMADTVSAVQGVQSTLKGFESLRKYSDEGGKLVFALWPSEYNAFNAVKGNLQNKMDQIVQDLGNGTLQQVGSMQASLANALKIKNKIIPQNTEYGAALKDGSKTEAWEKTYRDTLNTMISALAADRIQNLNDMPNSMSSLNDSIAWNTQFEKDFAQFTDFQQVQAVPTTFNQKRNTIFQAIKPAFVAKLSALSSDLNNVPEADRLLKATFSLASDEALPSFPEFKKSVEKHKERILSQLVAGKLEALGSIPPTMPGASSVIHWKTAFDEGFSSYAAYKPVKMAEQAWQKKRAKILRTAKAEFIEMQEELPADREGLRQAVELLDDIFPTLEDESLSIYREYRNIVLSQIKKLRKKVG